MKLFGGIEAGGTKFVCAIGDETGKILSEVTLPTHTPEETLPAVIKFFQESEYAKKITAFGIGSFGPIDCNVNSLKYGYITSTPKKDWINCDIVGAIKDAFKKPVGFATDVATAALGEYAWGEGQNLDHLVYMTIGTGIGAASVINGELLHGAGHQEIGHMLIPQDKKLDPFEGICPYHHNCFEGLASGVAIKKRWSLESALYLPNHHKAWDIEADYIAAGLMNIILNLSPNKIILGGGVMRQTHLFAKIRERVVKKINGYVQLENMDTFIVPPGLSDRSGVVGAIALAKKTLEK